MNCITHLPTLVLLVMLAPQRATCNPLPTDPGMVSEAAEELVGPRRKRCAAYGRKHLRKGRCGARNRRVERFLRGYTW
jgi:hypothetical protein